MIAVVDYGVGNLFSLKCSFASLSQDTIVTSNKNEIINADKIILPGVGAFFDASKKLFDSGLAETLIYEACKGKPLLGICLGMQLLFDESCEYGNAKGLGLIGGKIVDMKSRIPNTYKVPHMGWNSLDFKNESKLFSHIKNGDYVYFVHSYFAECDNKNIIATADYGIPITAAVQKDNVLGCQFHPEKSGTVGLSILKAFCEMGD